MRESFLLSSKDQIILDELSTTLKRLDDEAMHVSADLSVKLGVVISSIDSMPSVIDGLSYNLSIQHQEDFEKSTKTIWQLLYAPDRFILGAMHVRGGIISADGCDTMHELNTTGPCYAEQGIIWCEEVQSILDSGDAHFTIEGTFEVIEQTPHKT